jgi:extracellular factor (EF) 3-hydroxypalmitic acid methyl ester biosynthesis protein
VQEALHLLSELSDEDAAWLLENGVEQQVIANTLLIREGERPEALYIVLDGLVRVEVEVLGQVVLAHPGPGELIGEISFLDGGPASATVTAAENSLLLVLSRKMLERKLADDPPFAARFYRACALILSQRLRDRTAGAGIEIREGALRQSALAEVWDRVSEPVERLKALLRKADQQAIRNHDVVPEELAQEVVQTFLEGMEFLNREVGDASGLPAPVRQEVGAYLQRELLPYLLLTRIGERSYAKPRGYAGDFLTIQWYYENRPEGVGRLGPLIDRCFLEIRAAQAVRNRRGLLAAHITEALRQAEDRTARITSMASGPAAEVFDVFAGMEDPSRLHASLIDIDLQALAFVSDHCDRLKLRRHVDLHQGNLVYLAMGRQKLNLREQDLVYSIGLIDYFSDKFVIALLNYAHSLLRPGGKVVLGNFHPGNPDKVLMDHVLDWKLIHRSEEDMNRLYAASRFGRPCTNIQFEAAGVNLFAECVRTD